MTRATRRRMWLVYVVWMAVAAANVAVPLLRLWWLAFPVGCGSVMFAASFTHRLILGRWLDYRPALRAMFGRDPRLRRP